MVKIVKEKVEKVEKVVEKTARVKKVVGKVVEKEVTVKVAEEKKVEAVENFQVVLKVQIHQVNKKMETSEKET